MNSSEKSSLNESLNSVENSLEIKIYRQIQALKATFRVFQGNHDELLKYLEHLKDSEKSLEIYRHNTQQNTQILIDETSRLFHNFLASAKSLVDHTRVCVTKKLYTNHDFKNDYQTKIDKELATNEIQKFIQELRNYTQHYTLPLMSLEIVFQQDTGIDFRMKLDTVSLSMWENWGHSKQYLERNIEGIFVEDLVREYYQLIADFYQWFDKRQHEIHKSDFDKLQLIANSLYI